MGVYASPGDVPLGILGGCAARAPSYGNPDPISDKKISLFLHVLRPGLKEIMSSLLRLEH